MSQELSWGGNKFISSLWWPRAVSTEWNHLMQTSMLGACTWLSDRSGFKSCSSHLPEGWLWGHYFTFLLSFWSEKNGNNLIGLPWALNVIIYAKCFMQHLAVILSKCWPLLSEMRKTTARFFFIVCTILQKDPGWSRTNILKRRLMTSEVSTTSV